MKVLFVTRSHIGINRGGGLGYQIIETKNALVKKGVEVISFNPWLDQVKESDICHFFSSDTGMIYHIEQAKRLGKKIVLSPVLSNLHYNSAVHRAIVGISEVARGFLSGYKVLKKMMSLSDVIIALNQQEKERIVYAFEQVPEKILIVPNGYASNFIDSDSKMFVEKYSLSDFVLNVSFIGPRKNQQTLIRAMSGLPYKLVIIGGASLGCESYEKECRKMAGENILFLGRMENIDPILSSAYGAARLFVLPSIYEIQPLVFPEAALGGCPIITTKKVSAHPGLEGITSHVNAKNVHGLRKKIVEIMESSVDKNEIKKMARNVIRSWGQVADQIYDIYSACRVKS